MLTSFLNGPLSDSLRLADLIDGAVDDVDAAGPVDLHGAEE